MPRVDVDAKLDDFLGRYRRTQLLAERRIEAAALLATHRASGRAKTDLRGAMSSAGLGRLGNALSDTSDFAKGTLKRYPDGGFSASGTVFIRTRSERTRGAIEAYTQGADIRPVRGRWLWIPTDEAPARINRKRATPQSYIDAGSPLGELVRITAVNGRPLLAVKNVGKSQVGARGGRVRSLTKSGRARKGDRLKELSILFVAIPRTARAARVNVRQIVGAVQADLPLLFEQAVGRTFR